MDAEVVGARALEQSELADEHRQRADRREADEEPLQKLHDQLHEHAIPRL
jgi:hypothetical protein